MGSPSPSAPVPFDAVESLEDWTSKHSSVPPERWPDMMRVLKVCNYVIIIIVILCLSFYAPCDEQLLICIIGIGTNSTWILALAISTKRVCHDVCLNYNLLKLIYIQVFFFEIGSTKLYPQ